MTLLHQEAINPEVSHSLSMSTSHKADIISVGKMGLKHDITGYPKIHCTQCIITVLVILNSEKDVLPNLEFQPKLHKGLRLKAITGPF